MKRLRFTRKQIIDVLKENQAGATASDLCRKHGISDATFYTWRSKYGGMEISDARKPKGLEEENAKLKKLLAESILDMSTLKKMLSKLLTPGLRRPAAIWGGAAQGSACEARGMPAEGMQQKSYSQRRACGLVGLVPIPFI